MAEEAPPDGGWQDADIAPALGAQVRPVERIRQKWVDAGIEAALTHTRPKRTRRNVMAGAAEARLSPVSCRAAPAGHESWGLPRLADKRIGLEGVETVSRETGRTPLKKTRLNRG